MDVRLDLLAAGKYLSLTTFRADGTPVATPVWLVRDGDELRVITDGTSGKVRRIRANPNIRVAPCDARGRLSGPTFPAVAALQDEAGTNRTADMITRRYGLLGRVFMWRSGRRRRNNGESISQGLTIRLSAG